MHSSRYVALTINLNRLRSEIPTKVTKYDVTYAIIYCLPYLEFETERILCAFDGESEAQG